VLLTQARLADRLPERSGHTVLLDDDWPAIGQHAEEDLPGAATGADLAYVIYTSGSTGRPKGTAVPQRAVTRLVLGTDYVELTPADVVAQASNCSFDAATFEIWGALLCGARLEIVDQETLVTPRKLAAKIRRTGINTMFVTTALLNQLVQDAPDVFSGLRHLLFGGEAVSPRHVRTLLRGRPPARLVHVYGPTETTTFATWHLVEQVAENATTIPIGRPIANTTLYLLDGNMQPVPVGIPGEVYVGGDGVARGYLNRRELRAERFVPDPFSGNAESRLYKTGDLARYLPDGNVEFLARIDNQVKLRGFRIEPAEIEAALERHPAVEQSLVTVREDVPGDKRLVAYVVPGASPAPATSQLRSFLGKTLPDYMIPSAFVSLEALPLTPNGKVDRRALPAPDRARPDTEDAYQAPRTRSEEQLAGIWADVLHLDRVGVRDNFFELGGHSLLAVHLFARIEKAFGINLPLATLFGAPTVEQLAPLLGESRPTEKQASLVTIRARGARRPFYFIHGGDGHVLKFHTVADLLGPDQPLYALEAQGTDGRRLPLDHVEEMAAAYLEEVRAFQPQGPYHFGGFSFGGLVAFEMARQLHAQGEEVGLLVLFDTVHPGVNRRSTLTDNWLTRLPQRIRRRLQRLLYRAVYSVYLSAGRPVPPFFRYFYLRDSGRRANRRYLPRHYAGRITYFLAAERAGWESVNRWRRLAGEGVGVVSIGGRHPDMFKGENAQKLAERLKACLDQAHASGDSPGKVATEPLRRQAA
jgi:amino acid adenylation domain-containing protein